MKKFAFLYGVFIYIYSVEATVLKPRFKIILAIKLLKNMDLEHYHIATITSTRSTVIVQLSCFIKSGIYCHYTQAHTKHILLARLK